MLRAYRDAIYGSVPEISPFKTAVPVRQLPTPELSTEVDVQCNILADR
jgi:hypothetical protein